MLNKTKDNVLGKTSRIVEGVTLKGDIESKSDIRLDGELEGTIVSEGKIIIGPKGKIKGSVQCKNIDVEGSFNGNLKTSGLLIVKASAKIKGEVVVAKLSVEPGALFEATCAMKTNLKSLPNEQQEQTATA